MRRILCLAGGSPGDPRGPCPPLGVAAAPPSTPAFPWPHTWWTVCSAALPWGYQVQEVGAGTLPVAASPSQHTVGLQRGLVSK